MSFTVIISKTSTKFCPVGHVRRFLEAEKLDQLIDKEAFLIPRLFKTKKGHNVSKTKGAVIVYDREERQGRTQGYPIDGFRNKDSGRQKRHVMVTSAIIGRHVRVLHFR